MVKDKKISRQDEPDFQDIILFHFSGENGTKIWN